MSDTIDLLYQAIAAERRGMHALGAIRAARAAGLMQKAADELQRAARLGDITTHDLPEYLRRQAE